MNPLEIVMFSSPNQVPSATNVVLVRLFEDVATRKLERSLLPC